MTKTKKNSIPYIIDYILRNNAENMTTGLYNGKAGLSLSLFIASKYLKDEKIEDIAFNMLQETLVIKNNDLSFENGLPGIGYTLLYLIENNYIDADFDDIFGEQYEGIVKYYENIDKDPPLLVNSLTVIYFLHEVTKIKDDKRIKLIIKKIFEGLELFLTIHFLNFDNSCYIGVKTDVLSIYEMYLCLVNYSEYANFSRSVLNDYIVLYHKGKVLSSVKVGYYLKMITSYYNIKECKETINDNIRYGISNIYHNTLSLKEKIDLSKLVNENELEQFLSIEVVNNDKEIKHLLKKIDNKSNPLGYGSGLARFLIYCMDKDIKLL